MLSRKNYLFLFLGISTLVAVYLWYVGAAQKKSVEKYINDPHSGDVYKMEKWFEDQGKNIFYLKIKDIGQESIYFYRSTIISNTLNDMLLNHYDTGNIEVYSKKELREIKDGKWNVLEKRYTTIKEISRK